MKNLISQIQSNFKADILKKEERQFWLKISRRELPAVCLFLKKNGFDFFSSLSAVDMPAENTIELIYHLWSEKRKAGLNLKTKVDRKKPVIKSISEIYFPAQIQEREICELFGVDFLNNPNLSGLFLEDWPGPPPFLKDFDWRSYVREKFYDQKKQDEKGYF
jgi:NADH-quinone oxidoreductase subunit C